MVMFEKPLICLVADESSEGGHEGRGWTPGRERIDEKDTPNVIATDVSFHIWAPFGPS